MGAEHAPETVWKAQELYCVDRLSYAAVARALGVADSTVRRWGAQYNWRAERDAIAKAESEIRSKTAKARAHMLDKLLDAKSAGDAAQGAFGVSALEKLVIEQHKIQARHKEAAEPPAPGVSLVSQDKNASPETAAQESLATLPEGLDDAGRVALLEQAVDRQLAYVLSHPVEDLSRRVKEIKAAMDVLASLKGKDDSGQAVLFGFEE